jgi:tetratricopeptide (TPR) repeat protein
MMFAAIPKKGAEDLEEAAALPDAKIHPTNIINDVNGNNKENREETPTVTAAIEKGARNQGTIDNTVGGEWHQSGRGQQESFAALYFSIAAKFADQQLWQIALEYYSRVFEEDSDNLELAAKIAKMKSEIQNQTVYEKGKTLIKKDRYDDGIAELHKIAENSFYFDKAAQAITAAKEKMGRSDR